MKNKFDTSRYKRYLVECGDSRKSVPADGHYEAILNLIRFAGPGRVLAFFPNPKAVVTGFDHELQEFQAREYEIHDLIQDYLRMKKSQSEAD